MAKKSASTVSPAPVAEEAHVAAQPVAETAPVVETAPVEAELDIIDPDHVETFEDVAETAPVAEQQPDPLALSEADKGHVIEEPPVAQTTPWLANFALSLTCSTSQAYDIAAFVARKWKLPVDVMHAGDNVLHIAAPEEKVVRAQPAAVDTGERPVTLLEAGSLSKIALAPVKVITRPTAQQERVIALCLREEGATTADLYTTTTSTQGVPWKDVVANCAKRFGYVLTVATRADRRTAYLLRAHSVSEPARDANVA
jgi:hypothetical protein